MHLDSLESPVYLPEASQQTVLRLGVQPLDLRQWTLPARDLASFHAHKLQVRQAQGDRVCQVLPGAEAACGELNELLLRHLLADHGDAYIKEGGSLWHRPSGLRWSLAESDLWHTSLWVQEDLCLLERGSDDYVMTAASVCSPSNWPLEEKMGCGLDFIHGPVPGYQEELSSRVNRLFDALKPGKPLLRLNWSVQWGNELFWRKDLGLGCDGRERYWRVERQTLRRLPRTGAVVFTIRISLHSFSSLAVYPEFQSNLRAIVARLPGELKEYKGLQHF